MTRALLLAGHGSAHDRESSAPVYAHAARIRARLVFDEVHVAFWKEQPYLRDALRLITARDVYVVPMFLASGYYTRQVVPRELGLDAALSCRGAQLIRYCHPVGAHAHMPRLVLQRARQTARLTAAERRNAALVVVGHGTKRSATSAGTVLRVVARLRRTADFGTVTCGFLDEEPAIDRVIEELDHRNVVLTPFFLAEGYHTRTTIPGRLGLAGSRTTRGRRTFWYTLPIGTMPEVADIIVELADSADARSASLHALAMSHGSTHRLQPISAATAG
jgi:sirohydrochlorin cobaltochelatase